MKLTHASVFSGIGGPEVAAVMLGWRNAFHCEINPFGRAVLDYWFPNSKSYEDITNTDFSEWRGKIQVLTGGFPCQPFSYAGQRRGATDDRYLWPYMFRCIDQIQPDYVVAENVAGILTMVEQGEVSQVASSADLFDTLNDIRGYRLRETFTLQRICDDLEGHGYTVQPVLVPACAVGAPHRRDRVFIIGRRNGCVSQDTMRGRQLVGRDGEQGSERNERNAGTRGGQRICDQTSRTAPADSADLGQRRPANPGAESELSQTLRGEGCRAELYLSTEAASGRWPITDTSDKGLQEPKQPGRSAHSSQAGAGMDDRAERSCGNRWQGFPTVSPVHRGNDGLPFDVDDLTIPFSKWRTEALKAYGNAIVPQVMYEIFRAIEQTYN